jgi:hypothetical protein
MRVVHNSTKKIRLTKEPGDDWRDLAKEFEQNEDYAEAMEAYHQDVKENPGHENSWHRLMVLYRKERNYKKEWETITDAIAAFEKLYTPGGKKAHGKKIETISKALMRSTGLTDRKGKPVYQPEPLGKWYRRRELLKKKMNGTKK